LRSCFSYSASCLGGPETTPAGSRSDHPPRCLDSHREHTQPPSEPGVDSRTDAALGLSMKRAQARARKRSVLCAKPRWNPCRFVLGRAPCNCAQWSAVICGRLCAGQPASPRLLGAPRGSPWRYVAQHHPRPGNWLWSLSRNAASQRVNNRESYRRLHQAIFLKPSSLGVFGAALGREMLPPRAIAGGIQAALDPARNPIGPTLLVLTGDFSPGATGHSGVEVHDRPKTPDHPY
jgi:hypothetical protein